MSIFLKFKKFKKIVKIILKVIHDLSPYNHYQYFWYILPLPPPFSFWLAQISIIQGQVRDGKY